MTLAVRSTLSCAFVFAVLLLGPSLARASVVTLGPALGSSGAAESCPTDDSVHQPFTDCAYVNSTEPTGVIAQAPADGTITTWRVAGFQGTAKLLVLKATGGGAYEIVQKSAPESEACVPSGSLCLPNFKTAYVFATSLPIKAGEYIGVEGISPANCGNLAPADADCTYFGIGPQGATSQYWDTAPAVGASATPTASDTGRLVNADENTSPKTVSVSLAPATVTADGRSETTATVSVTQGGSPVAGDSLSIASSDGGEKVGAVTDNGNGTYTATITSSHEVEMATITATDTSDPSGPSGTATLTQQAPSIAVSVIPTSIKADGKSTANVTVTVKDLNGGGVPGEHVTIAATGAAFAGLVSDKGNGTYASRVTASHTAGKVTVTATDGSVSPAISASARLTLTTVKKLKACKVPKLAGHTLAAAKAALKRAGCKVGKIKHVASAKVRKGRVISSTLKPHSKHRAGKAVGLIVSQGLKAKLAVCIVPKLNRDTLRGARGALARAGCKLGKVTMAKSTTVPKGEVLSSSPRQGSKHKRRTPVSLVISRGKH